MFANRIGGKKGESSSLHLESDYVENVIVWNLFGVREESIEGNAFLIMVGIRIDPTRWYLQREILATRLIPTSGLMTTG